MKTVGIALVLAGLIWGGYDWFSADATPTAAQSVVAQPVVNQPTVEQPVVVQPVVTQPIAQMTLPPEVARTGIIDYKEIDGQRWVGFRENKASIEDDIWISCETVIAGAVALPEPAIWYVETYCNE